MNEFNIPNITVYYESITGTQLMILEAQDMEMVIDFGDLPQANITWVRKERERRYLPDLRPNNFHRFIYNGFEWKPIQVNRDVLTPAYIVRYAVVEADHALKKWMRQSCLEYATASKIINDILDTRKRAEKFEKENNKMTKEAAMKELGIQEVADLRIKNVIFNKPATIVLWEDGTKTVVKCQKGDKYDKEKGLAFCILKKIYGTGFNDIMKYYC